MPRTRSLLPLAVVLALGLSGCAAVSDDGRPRVLASIYPLQFLAQEIAGDRAVVGSVTPAGAEPHDLELGSDPCRVGRERLGSLRVDSRQGVRDGAGERREERGVEPEVGVAVVIVALVAVVVGLGSVAVGVFRRRGLDVPTQREHVGRVDHGGLARAQGEGIVDRGLEARHVHEHVRAPDRAHLH
ncbi:MAG: metal ABC transporter substrate-binding protein, partial [Actinomycetota bacterium]|nr:metal ABC transporter substrate-binding protein [Actinomycetota bacterium]